MLSETLKNVATGAKRQALTLAERQFKCSQHPRQHAKSHQHTRAQPPVMLVSVD